MTVPVFPIPFTAAEDAALAGLLRQRFQTDAARFCRLYLNGVAAGYLKQPWLAHVLQDWPLRLEESADGVFLYTDDWLLMGEALQHMAYGWHQAGHLGGWRDERFSMTHPEDGRVLFALERAAFRPLGLCSHAVHLNGLGQGADGWGFWIARRSPFKAVDPNRLDNMVGGGIAAGESVQQALLREGFEEAGLPADWLHGCVEQSRLFSEREVARGLHREWLHIFDVVLPPRCRPENRDGVVAEFMLLRPDELAAAMLAGQFMNDALLATLDACRRHGLLPANGAVSAQLCAWAEPIQP